jgi:hypothetical protein
MTHPLPHPFVLDAKAVASGQDLPTPELFGITETKDLGIFLAHLASAAVHWRWTAPATFVTGIENLFPAAVQAVQGIENIPDEIGDLSDKEITELAYIIERTVDFSALNISDEEAEGVGADPQASYGIEETADIARMFAQLLSLGIEYRKYNAASLAVQALTMAPVLFKAIGGISAVPKELGDLEEAEIAVLHTILRDEFHVDSIDLELAVEEAWAAVLMWYRGVMLLMKMLAAKQSKSQAAKEFTRQLVLCLGHLAVLYRLVKPLMSPPESTPVVGEGLADGAEAAGEAENVAGTGHTEDGADIQ